MCITLYIPQPHADDLEITTIGALRNALNVEPELFDGVRSLPDDACLCQCDIKATALQAGYNVDDFQWDGWVLRLTPKLTRRLRAEWSREGTRRK